MRRVPLFAFSFAVVVVAVMPAQGVQPLNGAYRYVRPSFYFGSSSCTGPITSFEDGTIQMRPDGTFSLANTKMAMCAAGSFASSDSNSNCSYAVAADGTCVIDFDPVNPGTDTARLFMRPDGGVLVHAPAVATDEGTLALAVRLSSGRSNADLNGAYHVVKFQCGNSLAGIDGVTEVGLLSFDGVGNCSGSVSRHTVSAAGVTTPGSYPIASTYSVFPNGELHFTPSSSAAPGAVSADGELFFAGEQSSTSCWLVVGIRVGYGHTLADLQGTWGVGDLNVLHGVGSALPVFGTDFLQLQANAAGAWTGTGFWLDNANGTPPSTLSGTGGATGSAQLLSGDGQLALQFSPAGHTAHNFTAALSASSQYLLGISPTNATSGLVLGLRLPPYPTNYGSATAGSGAFAPQLRSTGGFAYPGNSSFGLIVDHTVGGSFAMVCFANRAAAAPGVPLLGGTLWLDPTHIFTWLGLGLSGAPSVPGVGAGTLPFALPARNALRGLQCYVQAAVFDSGAPQGFAMTPGLDLLLAR